MQTVIIYVAAAPAEIGGCFAVRTRLWVVEGMRPDRWDRIGAALCLVGAAVIVFAL